MYTSPTLTNSNIITVGKNQGEFCYKMKNLYLFIQINFIPFKVIPSRYNALMPTFFPIVETLVKFRNLTEITEISEITFKAFFDSACISSIV